MSRGGDLLVAITHLQTSSSEAEVRRSAAVTSSGRETGDGLGGRRAFEGGVLGIRRPKRAGDGASGKEKRTRLLRRRGTGGRCPEKKNAMRAGEARAAEPYKARGRMSRQANVATAEPSQC